MMSRRIETAIRFNQCSPVFAKLTWLPILERSLQPRTVEYLDDPEANLDFKVLSEVARQSIDEAHGNESEIDDLLWNKLHDWNLVVGLMQKFGITESQRL